MTNIVTICSCLGITTLLCNAALGSVLLFSLHFLFSFISSGQGVTNVVLVLQLYHPALSWSKSSSSLHVYAYYLRKKWSVKYTYCHIVSPCQIISLERREGIPWVWCVWLNWFAPLKQGMNCSIWPALLLDYWRALQNVVSTIMRNLKDCRGFSVVLIFLCAPFISHHFISGQMKAWEKNKQSVFLN